MELPRSLAPSKSTSPVRAEEAKALDPIAAKGRFRVTAQLSLGDES